MITREKQSTKGYQHRPPHVQPFVSVFSAKGSGWGKGSHTPVVTKEHSTHSRKWPFKTDPAESLFKKLHYTADQNNTKYTSSFKNFSNIDFTFFPISLNYVWYLRCFALSFFSLGCIIPILYCSLKLFDFEIEIRKQYWHVYVTFRKISIH